jgi:hypothetical protein
MPENKGLLEPSPRPFHEQSGWIITGDEELSRAIGLKNFRPVAASPT